MATAIAGLPGGPAKVAILSSVSMGTISGSSIANTVTTGALTIPAMKRTAIRPILQLRQKQLLSVGDYATHYGGCGVHYGGISEIPLRDILTAALFLPCCTTLVFW